MKNRYIILPKASLQGYTLLQGVTLQVHILVHKAHSLLGSQTIQILRDRIKRKAQLRNAVRRIDGHGKKSWFQSWTLGISRARLSKVQGQLPSRRFQVWMKHKAQPRNAVRRIGNTLNEYRKLQRSDSPKPPAASMAMPLHRLAGPVRSGRGDTIVEVMISTAILAVVLATAYTTSTHSLQSGLNAKYRDQALTHARAQIELIKSADNQRPPTVDDYKLNHSFCINPADAGVQEVDSTTKACSLPIGETNPDKQSIYSVVDNYSSASKTFTATVSWQSANNVPNQTTLYYKAYGSFVSGSGL